LGALIFDPITLDLVNPQHLDKVKATDRFPDSVNSRFTYMLRMMAVIFASMAVVSIIMIFQGRAKLKPQKQANVEESRVIDMLKSR